MKVSPLLFFYLLIIDKNLGDDELAFYLRKLFAIRLKFFIETPVFRLIVELKEDKPKSYYTIMFFYEALYFLFTNVKKYVFIKKIMPKTFTRINDKDIIETINLQINKMIFYLDNLKAIEDLSFGKVPFSAKLGNAPSEYQLCHLDEMINRLKTLVTLLGTKFFIGNNIKLVTYEHFIDLTWNDKIKLYKTTILQTAKKLNSYCNFLKELHEYLHKVLNILKPKKIVISYNFD